MDEIWHPCEYPQEEMEWFSSFELGSCTVCEGGAIIFHFFCTCSVHTVGLDEDGCYRPLFYRACEEHEPIINAWFGMVRDNR